MALKNSWKGINTWRSQISLKKHRWTTKKTHFKQKSTKTCIDFTLMSSVGCPILNKVLVEHWMQPEDQELSKEPILCFLLHRLSTTTLPKISWQNVLQTTLSFPQRGIHSPLPTKVWTRGHVDHAAAQVLIGRTSNCWTFTVAFFGTQITSCIPFNPNWFCWFSQNSLAFAYFWDFYPLLNWLRSPNDSESEWEKWHKYQWMHWEAPPSGVPEGLFYQPPAIMPLCF